MKNKIGFLFLLILPGLLACSSQHLLMEEQGPDEAFRTVVVDFDQDIRLLTGDENMRDGKALIQFRLRMDVPPGSKLTCGDDVVRVFVVRKGESEPRLISSACVSWGISDYHEYHPHSEFDGTLEGQDPSATESVITSSVNLADLQNAEKIILKLKYLVDGVEYEQVYRANYARVNYLQKTVFGLVAVLAFWAITTKYTSP